MADEPINKLYSFNDAQPQQPYALPVDDNNSIDKWNEYLKASGIMPSINRVVRALTIGLPGEERTQLLPEKIIRSGVTAPARAYEGEFTPRTELNETSEQAYQRMFEAGQDTAALMSGSTIFNKPGAATLGSGLTRPEIKPVVEAPAPIFYSAVENAIKNAKQPTATMEQWQGFLKNQPGVKAEELSWLGLDKEALGPGPVSKQALEDYVRAHKVELKEITKFNEADYGTPHERELAYNYKHELKSLNSSEDVDLARKYNTYFRETFKNMNNEEVLQAVKNAREIPTGEPTKFGDYQLSNGRNYKEMLLTLPEKKSLEQFKIEYEKKFNVDLSTATEQQLNRLREQVEPIIGNTYKSSHWDEPNVLAHIRMNDRDIPGVGKALHIEEIQSDFLQAHRKAQTQIAEAINKDFDGIADKMVKAGVIKKICD